MGPAPCSFYPFIELIYQIPYWRYSMQLQQFSEVCYYIQVNVKTVQGTYYEAELKQALISTFENYFIEYNKLTYIKDNISNMS